MGSYKRLSESGGMLIEIEAAKDRSSVLGLDKDRTEVISSDEKYFESEFSIINKSALLFEKQLKDTNVGEAEVTFGLKVSSTGLYISQGIGKANYIVKLKWTRMEK